MIDYKILVKIHDELRLRNDIELKKCGYDRKDFVF